MQNAEPQREKPRARRRPFRGSAFCIPTSAFNFKLALLKFFDKLGLSYEVEVFSLCGIIDEALDYRKIFDVFGVIGNYHGYFFKSRRLCTAANRTKHLTHQPVIQPAQVSRQVPALDGRHKRLLINAKQPGRVSLLGPFFFRILLILSLAIVVGRR